MRFTNILSSALLAATTLAAPSSSSSSSSSSTDLDSLPSVIQAKSHGVDPFGPMPDGVTKLPNGGYSAQPETEAWYWVLAQLDIVVFTSSHPSHRDVDVAKRQFSPPINLAIFAEPGCRGQIFFFPEMPYEVVMPQPVPVPAKSVGLFGRPLFPDEKLEFLRHSSGVFCGQLISDLAPNTAPGCYPVDEAQCFRLKKV